MSIKKEQFEKFAENIHLSHIFDWSLKIEHVYEFFDKKDIILKNTNDKKVKDVYLKVNDEEIFLCKSCAYFFLDDIYCNYLDCIKEKLKD